jgi:hypothetical protein
MPGKIYDSIQEITTFLVYTPHGISFVKVLQIIVSNQQFDKNIKLNPLLVDYIYQRAHRLRENMITPSQQELRALLFCYHLPTHQHTMALHSSEQNDVLFQAVQSNLPSGTPEWDRKVTQLVGVLCQYTSPDLFNYFLQQEKRLRAAKETNAKFALNFTQDMLHEAAVHRIFQIVKEKEGQESMNDSLFKDVSLGSIGKWIAFADQLYFLVNKTITLMSFKQLLFGEKEGETSSNENAMSVRKLVEIHEDRMKDHFVTWLILQLLRMFCIIMLTK